MAIKNKNIKEDSNPIEESGRAHSSSATPIVTPTLPTTSTLKIMPWFWGGVVASIPTLLFLGNSRQMDSLIGRYSISYFLIIALFGWIYRRVRKVPAEDSVFGVVNSTPAKIISYSMWLVAGHGIGFAILGLFFQQF